MRYSAALRPPDRLVAELTSRLAEVRTQLQTISGELERKRQLRSALVAEEDRLLGVLHLYGGESEVVRHEPTPDATLDPPDRSARSATPSRATGSRAPSWRSQALEQIRMANQPLHYKTLLSGLREAGVIIPGRRPEATLLSYLSRDSNFAGAGRGYYSASAPSESIRGAARVMPLSSRAEN